MENSDKMRNSWGSLRHGDKYFAMKNLAVTSNIGAQRITVDYASRGKVWESVSDTRCGDATVPSNNIFKQHQVGVCAWKPR